MLISYWDLCNIMQSHTIMKPFIHVQVYLRWFIVFIPFIVIYWRKIVGIHIQEVFLTLKRVPKLKKIPKFCFVKYCKLNGTMKK